jgi:hypothetical protein
MERGFKIRRNTRRTKAREFPGWAIGGGFQIRVPSNRQAIIGILPVQKSALKRWPINL